MTNARFTLNSKTEANQSIKKGEVTLSKGIKTDSALMQKLQSAAKRSLSPTELHKQRVSFILGNLPKDSNVTREQVEKVLDRLEGKKAS